MKRISLEHTIHCTQERFWEVFFDPAYNRELYLEHLGFARFEILEQREVAGGVHRRVSAQPSLQLPKALAKLVGEGFSYEETGKLDAKGQLWSWTMQPSALGDKLRNHGSMRLEAVGDDRVKRVTELVCEARVFGLAGMIESMNEKELRSGWNKSAVFMNRWLTEHA